MSINPRPGKEFFDWFYREEFWTTYIGKDIGTQADLFHLDRPDLKAKQILDRIESHVGKQMARVLDIGCGLGGLLQALKDNRPDFIAIGVDPSESGCRFVEESGLNVLQTEFGQLHERVEGPFDYIFSIHVLEHVEDPAELLKTAHRLLEKDGVAYFEVPNLLSLKWLSQKYDFFHLAHLHYFSTENFKYLAEKSGFRVIDVVRGAAEIWPWAVGIVCVKCPPKTSPLGSALGGLLLKWNYLMVRLRLFMLQGLSVIRD
jgi:2-polyprenyl-3-methyl-5-hydroxy-6-metoxy-1,4-benzoquinol methylase